MTTAPPDALLTDLTHLRFSGPDALRYLNGQVTQKLDGMTEGETRYTFVCDAKGKVLFDAYLTRQGDDYLLNASLALKDEIIARLDRYLIADDCQWSDESEQWAIAHHFVESTAAKTHSVNRFGELGLDSILPRAEALQLTANEDPESLENRRIAMGVPALPELAGTFPAETGREADAVSFHKGCYLGQEVVSRMKRAGRTNRSIISLTLSQTTSELPLNFVQTEGGKTVLLVTSLSTHPDPNGHFPALGFLSNKAEPEGEFLCQEQPEIRVEELPVI